MRKTLEYVIDAEGRDKGKKFFITEMPAVKAEDWACRCLFALGNANVEVPDGVFSLGMAGLAEVLPSVGLKALLSMKHADVKPLLDELMQCVQMRPDPRHPQVTQSYDQFSSQIEEVSTLFKLKWEVLRLHLDFLDAGGLSESLAKVLPAKQKPSTRTSAKA